MTPTPPARLIRGPRARKAAQDYVTSADYPLSALAAREQGRVRVELTIGANGRAVGCEVTGSSGSLVLDHTTCRLLRARGRFTPAVDSNGDPAPATIAQELEWRLP